MADGQLSQTINEIAEELTSDECKRLLYLCGNLDTDKGVDDVRGMLKSVMNGSEADHKFLPELMFRIRRYDILKKILQTNQKEVERILVNRRHVSEYRVLMSDLSEALGKEDLRSLMFLLSGTLSKGRMENSTSFLDIVVELEKLGKVSCENLELIEACLRSVRRIDLVKKVQQHQKGGPASLAGISVHRPVGHQQCPKGTTGETQFISPGHYSMWQCSPKPQVSAPENLKLAVPETRQQYNQSSVEEYRMWAEPRGVCVIIDCMGNDGNMLEEAFSRLHFRVILCKWPSVQEVLSILERLSQSSERQGDCAFVCCIISRATSTHLLATEQQGRGLSFHTIRRLFSTDACPGLAGKPKLFFIQSYSVPQPHYGYGDQDLETDGPVTTCAMESIPNDADVFWSLCKADEGQLEHCGHNSVYLQALSAALLKGQKRKLNLLDVHTEVNAVVYEHNHNSPGERYTISLQHTLRKALFI